MKKFLILLFITGCGLNVHVDPIDPIKVIHTITIDYNGAINYCNIKCSSQSSDPLIVQQCTNDCFNQFVDIINHATS